MRHVASIIFLCLLFLFSWIGYNTIENSRIEKLEEEHSQQAKEIDSLSGTIKQIEKQHQQELEKIENSLNLLFPDNREKIERVMNSTKNKEDVAISEESEIEDETKDIE